MPDVWLLNGFKWRETSSGPAFSISDWDGLHLAMARALVTRPSPISPRALRFLRGWMALGQAGLAALLGTTEQTFARWEKGTTQFSPPAQRLMRLLVLEQLGDAVPVRATLARVGDQGEQPLRLRRTSRGWRVAA